MALLLAVYPDFSALLAGSFYVQVFCFIVIGKNLFAAATAGTWIADAFLPKALDCFGNVYTENLRQAAQISPARPTFTAVPLLYTNSTYA
jgi:hypothetical protein